MAGKNKRRSNNKPDKESKICAGCGLEFHNRKKWESRGLWPSVQYCSDRCRRAARTTTADKVLKKHE